MLQQALQKIQAEVTAKAKDQNLQVVGSFLIHYLREKPQDSDKIMTEGKTIAGSIDAMKAEARKHQSGGVGMISDKEGFEIVLKYFGIEVPKADPAPAGNFNVSLDDLLGV